MFKKILLIIGIALGATGEIEAAHAQELGLTPSHVYGLWTNINNALVAVADASSGGGQVLAESLNAATPNNFENKKPSHVLERAIEFRAKLDRMLAAENLKPTKRYENIGGSVTPSVVFLNSGHLLDSVVLWIVANSSREQMINPFYTLHAFSGKTPSDVFSLVDLANRRIDKILTAAKS